MEKHELSAIDFKLIDDAFKALLQSNPGTGYCGQDQRPAQYVS